MPKSIAIQKQVDQVKFWLSKGLTTEQIRKKFAKEYENLRLSDRTIDNRIKEAKEPAKKIFKEGEKEADDKLKKEQKRIQTKLKKSRLKMEEMMINRREEVVKMYEQIKKTNELKIKILDEVINNLDEQIKKTKNKNEKNKLLFKKIEQLEKKNGLMASLQTTKTVIRLGYNFEKDYVIMRLAEGLPNQISKNDNFNREFPLTKVNKIGQKK